GISHLAHDDPTLTAAVELARGAGAALHLVHACEGPHLHVLSHPGGLERHQSELRERLAAAANGRLGAQPACHAVHGSPARAILRLAEETGADLVVAGAGGHAFVLGSTTARLVRDSPVPVFIVREPVRRPLERVLLATDLSPLSAAAHEQGLDAAAAVLGEPGALRSLLVVGAGTLPPPLPQAALDRTARSELRRFLAERRPRGAAVQAAVRTGPATDEIVAEADAWKADLLVLGALGHVLLGSVAEDVVRSASCNVLAVPAPRVAAAGDGVSEAA
ncbi:MAG TPA: universal stress protein, partial [Longimicrobium sp.]